MKPEQLLTYDLWANELWLDPADAMKRLDILEHIAGASEVWLARCQGVNRPEREDLPLLERFRFNAEEWTDYLNKVDLSARISYKSFGGEPYVSPVDAIFHHTINHGTYHRGQLRALAEAQGVPFPETDLIRYLRTMD